MYQAMKTAHFVWEIQYQWNSLVDSAEESIGTKQITVKVIHDPMKKMKTQQSHSIRSSGSNSNHSPPKHI
jgi:hypothetical protein